MDPAHPFLSTISSASFSPLLSSDIRSISVLQVTNTTLLDNNREPTVGGLYDPRLGPISWRDVCKTCRLLNSSCPGHFGHIELNVPVFHPFFMRYAYQLLRSTCFYCHHFLCSEFIIVKHIAKLRLLEHGLIEKADMIDDLPTAQKIEVTKRAADDLENDERKNEDSGKSNLEEVRDKQSSDLVFYKKSISNFVKESLRKMRVGQNTSSEENPKVGMCFQRKQKLISDLLKLLPKKVCGRCGAFSARMRKDGHTKVMEYSLVDKQSRVHKVMGKKRADVQDAKSESEDERSDGNNSFDGNHSKVKKSKSNKRSKQVENMMLPQEARAHLRLLFKNEREICDLLFAPHCPFGLKPGSRRAQATADMFFLEVVPVPPARFRPASIMGDQTLECPQNILLTNILTQTIRISGLNKELIALNIKPDSNNPLQKEELEAIQNNRARVYRQILEGCIGMQVAVNSLMDSTKNPTTVTLGKLPPQGIKQILEKKEGLFRMHMMGKRVNYAARSVISPDVNIETNEIGVPPIFAKKLTFPEFVTAQNFVKMHQLVCNGPHKHPGAVFVQDEDGTMISLDRMDEDSRQALANTLLNTSSESDRASRNPRPDIGLPMTRKSMVGKRVHRHLDDGDILILNRQPTLHKPSMMCHRARILKGEKTIRMHYANCNSYNADFDGDEMNIHFPQNLVAQSEARMIANNDNQYLVPTSGNPLRGLIQDHVVAGVWMTNKDTFFNREDYHQIIYAALCPESNFSEGRRISTVPPAIWKPRHLWTGKQLISTILKNITPANCGGLTLFSTSKVPAKFWGIHSSEESVQFYDGEMVSGVIDKSQIGASPYGLVHSVYDLYGPEISGKLLGILSRLFTKFLQHRAFTCRMDDLHLTEVGDQIRSRLLSETSERGISATLSTIGMTLPEARDPQRMVDIENRLQEVLRDDLKMAALDNAYSGETSSLQTIINNQCLPFGLFKPFPWNHMQMMTGSGAKGTPVNASQISCLLGQQSLEGRRVPVMVSGKTLPSFRPFETEPRAGGFVAQRFLTGIRPQEYYFHCMAGREGLIDTAVKTSRSGYLQRCLIKHLEGVRVHYDHTVRNSDASVLQFHYGDDSLDVTKQKHLHQFEFSLLNRESLVQRLNPVRILEKTEQEDAITYNSSMIHSLTTGVEPLPLPTMSLYSPSQHFGSISEKYTMEIEAYERKNPSKILKAKKSKRKRWPKYINPDNLISPEIFRSLMNVRFISGLVEPGEAVGLLASQGVGEPSTQMTLNTFHFAGHGAANVTLGIPRLREIVMTAATKIKTPTMKFPLEKSITDAQFSQFTKRIARLTLSQVVDEVIVEERLTKKRNGRERFKTYSVRLQLYPSKEYCSEYCITAEAVFKSITQTFMISLERRIMRELSSRNRELRNQFADIGKTKTINRRSGAGANREDKGGVEDIEDEAEIPARRDDDSDFEDGDADDQKRARQKEEVDYDKEEGSDEDDAHIDDERLRKLTGVLEAEAEDDEDKVSVDEFSKRDENDMDTAKEANLYSLRQLEEEAEGLTRYIQSVKIDKDSANYCEFMMEFPSSSPKLLLVGLIEQCCRTAVIQEIPGIARVLPAQADQPHENPGKHAMTEGANLRAAWSFGKNIIELNKLYSNDINAMLVTYGVEAARSSIIKEMSGVFGVYGIGVDHRHLTVIADYMTSEGGFKPFSRFGISSNVSPFLKASFETTVGFLTDASIFGDFDDLKSPSASIILGQAPRSGTNCFDLLIDTKC
ncbi:hypothetical protein BY996DRAFT_4594345 [Phakopsora pachyrhizi]|nr:hypothetical protein BY996DRAFT_4594345 [Phakopsora pachyrhizi]